MIFTRNEVIDDVSIVIDHTQILEFVLQTFWVSQVILIWVRICISIIFLKIIEVHSYTAQNP